MKTNSWWMILLLKCHCIFVHLRSTGGWIMSPCWRSVWWDGWQWSPVLLFKVLSALLTVEKSSARCSYLIIFILTCCLMSWKWKNQYFLGWKKDVIWFNLKYSFKFRTWNKLFMVVLTPRYGSLIITAQTEKTESTHLNGMTAKP